MHIITCKEDMKKLEKNIIVGEPRLDNSKIIFKGKGNILYCDEDNVTIKNSNLVFSGDNSIILLSKNGSDYLLDLTVTNNCVMYFGEDNYINKKLNIILSEQKNMIVGDKGMFSFDCWFRTADPHIIYDAKTRKRINNSKSIYIGDHVWIGQHSLILKGSRIGSGSVIGALSVVSGKTIESNSVYAGNPVKFIRDSVFFTSDCVHLYTDEDTEKHDVFPDDRFIYENKENEKISFDEIEDSLSKKTCASEKLDYILKTIHTKKSKNRFFIGR